MQSKRYIGLLLEESLPDGRVSGEIHLAGNRIIFYNETIEKSIAIPTLSIEQGGTSKRQIYFKTSGATFTLCTSDVSILKEEALKNNQNLSSNIGSIKTDRTLFKLSIGLAATLVVLPILALLFFKHSIIRFAANRVPASIENSLGETYIKQVSLTESLDSTSEAVIKLRKQAAFISNQLEDKQKFSIYISNAEEVNAYALPGGYVVFNRGLLEKAKSWEEVLGVMAHEMAHVTQKHHARGVLSRMGWTTLLSYFLGDGGVLTDLLFSSASKLESLSYSRSFESEADEKGFDYLQKAKISPSGLISFFATLQQEAGPTKHIPEMLSTHPASDNRVNNLSKKLDKEDKKQYLQLEDYQIFIKTLKNK